MNLNQAVTFAILMQGNGGILGKAPAYVEEKLRICGTLERPETILDNENGALYKKYMRHWRLEE